MDKIGIVTITYNSADVIRSFLESIFSQTFQNFVIYIIDNNSQDDTLEILKEYMQSKVKIVKNKKNVGVAKANNQGIKQAISDECNQILIINNDVEFENTLIQKLINVQNEKSCSLVAPKIMYYDNPNHIWYAGAWFVKSKGYLPSHRGMKHLDEGQFNQIIEVEYAPTCCLLVKKEVFEDVGLMNENFFVYFDDTDFSYRVWKHGKHKIMYYPFVEFYHKVGSLTKSLNRKGKNIYRGNFFIEQNVRNHVYFLKQIGDNYSYFFIVWLFFKNNIRFVINSQIRKNFSTWWLINKSYFEGVFK